MRWFRFRLRTLFIVTTVVAVTVHIVSSWPTTRLELLVSQYNELNAAGRPMQAAAILEEIYQLYPATEDHHCSYSRKSWSTVRSRKFSQAEPQIKVR